jgi:hypothetical protein
MLVSAGTSDTLVFGWLAVQRPIGAGPMISTFDCPYLGNSAHHRLADRLRNQQDCVILDFGSTLGQFVQTTKTSLHCGAPADGQATTDVIAGGQAGDLQALSNVEEVDSESVPS